MSADLSRVPSSFKSALDTLDGRWRLKVGHNTYLSRRPAAGGPVRAVVLIYHITVVATYTRYGAIILDSGGWLTSTTKARLNAALRDTPYSVVQRDYRWYIQDNRTPGVFIPFYNGVQLFPDRPVALLDYAQEDSALSASL